ncbi:DUF4405 domain-containing protein [bacterium]|nr:DUF4405 domain-containing protein [bacterium]
MNRTKTNFFVDAVALAAFLFLTTTGLLMRYTLPPGSGGRHGGEGTSVWGLTRHDWGGVHFWIAVGMLVVLAVHLLLHWRWILAVVRGKPREAQGGRALIGVFATLALIVLAAAPLLAPKSGTTESESRRGGRGSGREAASTVTNVAEAVTHGESETIRGSMSLAEVEQTTGVPATAVIAALGLPTDTDPGQRLGQLRRQHGFEMEAVRTIVAEYKAE